MKLSDIKNILTGDVEVWEVRRKNQDLFDNYRDDSLIKAGKAIVINIKEDLELFVGKHELRVLCDLFIKDKIKRHELAFIADVLGLSQNVQYESDLIEEYISHMTDPEVNGSFTKEYAFAIIKA